MSYLVVYDKDGKMIGCGAELYTGGPVLVVWGGAEEDNWELFSNDQRCRDALGVPECTIEKVTMPSGHERLTVDKARDSLLAKVGQAARAIGQPLGS